MDVKQENGSFRSPKNKKQIGKIGKGDKIYIEDYAVTYLNQVARNSETQGGLAGLFGTCREVDGIKEYYIYSAVYQECENVFENTLPREAVQKIMRQRAEMFVEYFFLGWALILKENKGILWENCYRSRLETLMGKPELLMTLQCSTCEEHFYLYPTEMPKETEGYFIFYEKNDAMQNFLIEWHGAIHKDKCDEGDLVAESCRNYYKEKKAARFRTRLTGSVAVVVTLLLIFCAGLGMNRLNNYDKIQEVGQNTSESFAFSEEQILIEETVLVSGNDNLPEENNVVEDKVVIPQEHIDENGQISEVKDNGEKEEKQVENAEAEAGGGQSGEMHLQEAEAGQKEAVEEPGEENDETYVTYEVCEGDTLYGICVRFYGNLSKAREICKLNNIENMDNIICGEKILLPES